MLSLLKLLLVPVFKIRSDRRLIVSKSRIPALRLWYLHELSLSSWFIPCMNSSSISSNSKGITTWIICRRVKLRFSKSSKVIVWRAISRELTHTWMYICIVLELAHKLALFYKASKLFCRNFVFVMRYLSSIKNRSRHVVWVVLLQIWPFCLCLWYNIWAWKIKCLTKWTRISILRLLISTGALHSITITQVYYILLVIQMILTHLIIMRSSFNCFQSLRELSPPHFLQVINAWSCYWWL